MTMVEGVYLVHVLSRVGESIKSYNNKASLVVGGSL